MHDRPAPTAPALNAQMEKRARVFGRSVGTTERPATIDELDALSRVSPDGQVLVTVALVAGNAALLVPPPLPDQVRTVTRAMAECGSNVAGVALVLDAQLFLSADGVNALEYIDRGQSQSAVAATGIGDIVKARVETPFTLPAGVGLYAVVVGAAGIGNACYRDTFVED